MTEQDLIRAILSNNNDLFWLCVASGVNPNCVDDDSKIPALILATQRRNHKFMGGLLAILGANPNVTAEVDKRTALDYAILNQDELGIRLLRKYHAKKAEEIEQEIRSTRIGSEATIPQSLSVFTPTYAGTARRRRTTATPTIVQSRM